MAAAARLMGCGKTESRQKLIFLARVEGATHQITGDEKEKGGGGQNVKLIPLKWGYTESSQFSHLFLIYLFLLLCCALDWISLGTGSATPVQPEAEHMPGSRHATGRGTGGRFWGDNEDKPETLQQNRGGVSAVFLPQSQLLAVQLRPFLVINFKRGSLHGGG